MMRFAMLLVGALALATPASAAGLIEPGIAVGPVRAGVTEADLRASLPDGQVKRLMWQLGEGFGNCATQVYAGTPEVFYVQWSGSPEYDLSEADADARCMAEPDRMQPSQVTIVVTKDNAGIWQTAEGIGIGMGIIDLSKTVGSPLTVLACPCDFGGYVQDPDDVLPEGLSLWVDFPPDVYLDLPDAVDVQGDYALSSSDIPSEMAALFPVRLITVDIGTP